MRDPLPRYPIASLDALPEGRGAHIPGRKTGGAGSWARAARGYRAVVADPSLQAALAGSASPNSLGTHVRHVVFADGRYLAVRARRCLAVSFLYLVLQESRE